MRRDVLSSPFRFGQRLIRDVATRNHALRTIDDETVEFRDVHVSPRGNRQPCCLSQSFRLLRDPHKMSGLSLDRHASQVGSSLLQLCNSRQYEIIGFQPASAL